MTHEELQQLRETLFWLLSKVPMKVEGAAARYERAKALIDAELAKPEELEWRVTWQGGSSSPSTRKAVAEETLNSFRGVERWKNREPRIEFRTPAGPWKRKILNANEQGISQ